MSFTKRLGIIYPIFQAPMAGVATPALAAAVSNAGGLGGLGVGTAGVAEARRLITETRKLTDRPFNLNVFVHSTPTYDTTVNEDWSKRIKGTFERFVFENDSKIFQSSEEKDVPKSFIDDLEMVELLLETKPPVVSFHFGIPKQDIIDKLHGVGCTLFATATNLNEFKEIEKAGLDGVVAQGIEAGGHRGCFDPKSIDEKYETIDLVRLFHSNSNSNSKLPIIAAGGIMNGDGIQAALKAGAKAVQLGTAFITCPESTADEDYKNALVGPEGYMTTYTTFVSGRAARGLPNRFTELQTSSIGRDLIPPDFPIGYAMSKAIAKAAKNQAPPIEGFTARWAGKNAPMARPMPAGDLVALLVKEAGLSA